MVLTAYVGLSPVTGLFCHRRPRTDVVPKPGRADITSANLTPASGRQDHTTSPYAATSFVSAPFDRSQVLVGPAPHHISRLTLPRPPHPIPRFVTIAIRPSCGTGWRGFVEMICPTGEAKYFCSRGWTLICPTGCLRVKALPSSAIGLHLHSADIDFIAEDMKRIQGWVEPAKPVISIRCD
jgi:hypothetical protein